MNFYELDFAGRWVCLERHPLLGGFSARYDNPFKQEKSSESQSRSSSFLPIQETALTQTLQAFLDQGRVGTGQESFAGQRVAPLSAGQQTAISGAEPFLDIFSAQREIPFLGQTGDALRGILSGETGAEQFTPERANEIFTQTRQLPAERTFERFTKPLIDEGFAGPGFQNTARPREVLREAEFLQQGLRGEREGFLGQIEALNRGISENKAGRTLSAIPLGAGLASLPEQIAGQRLAGRAGVFDFLGAGQQQQQAEINAERQVFEEARKFMDPEDFVNLLALIGQPFQQSQGTSAGFFQSPGNAGMTSLLSGAGAAAGGNIGIKATGGSRLF